MGVASLISCGNFTINNKVLSDKLLLLDGIAQLLQVFLLSLQ